MDADCILSRAGPMHVPDLPVGGATEEEPHFVRGEGGRVEEGGRRLDLMSVFPLAYMWRV